MPSQIEIQLAAALQHVKTTPDCSIRAAAKLYNVNRSTLTRHLHDGLSRQEGQAVKQLLTSKQEDMLVQWILQLEEEGHARIPVTIREMTAQISQNNGGPSTVGRHWLQCFYICHPEIHPKKGVLLTSDRANNANNKDLTTWFDQYRCI
jgi:helix-turn-helix, Psq domain/Tc5 transposase DNA-binding domain